MDSGVSCLPVADPETGAALDLYARADISMLAKVRRPSMRPPGWRPAAIVAAGRAPLAGPPLSHLYRNACALAPPRPTRAPAGQRLHSAAVGGCHGLAGAGARVSGAPARAASALGLSGHGQRGWGIHFLPLCEHSRARRPARLCALPAVAACSGPPRAVRCPWKPRPAWSVPQQHNPAPPSARCRSCTRCRRAASSACTCARSTTRCAPL